MDQKWEGFTIRDLLRIMKNKINYLHPVEKVKEIAKYHRIQNSPGIDDAINEMASQLTKAGIFNRIECFRSDGHTYYQDYLTPGGWVAQRGQLRLAMGDKVLADYQADPIQVVQRSCSTGGVLKLEVFAVDNISQLLVEKPDLTGKILLTDQNVHKIKDLVHDPFNASGIIFDGMRQVKGRDMEEMKNARQYTSFWWREGDRPTFGFVITPSMGMEIRKQIKKGEQVLVECEVEAEFIENPMKVLHAKIPGRTDENLLVVAHICHPYSSVNDNASGCAAGVEVMLFINQLIQEKVLPQPDRGIELILVPEFSGTYAFLERYLKKSNYLAGLNLDMVGEDQLKCGSTLYVIAPPLSLSGLTGDLLYYILTQVMDEHGYRLKKRPFTGGSDHVVLCDPLVGIPCPMLNQDPDKYYHTDQDTIEKLDPVILKDVALGSAVYLYYLANAHLTEIKEILDIYLSGFKDLVQSRVNQVLNSSEDKLSTNVWAYCNRWMVKASDCYLQIIEYMKKFISPEELGDFQKLSLAWQKRCQDRRSELIEVMNDALMELVKANPELNKPIQQVLGEVERELAMMVPVRKFWGISSVNPGRLRHGRKSLFEVWKVFEEDNGSTTLAQYWADGKRNLFEIMELVEMESGIRNPEFLRDYFKLLEEMGSIEILRNEN